MGVIVRLTAVLALVGCDKQAVLEGFVPDDQEQFARSYVELIRARDFDAAEEALEPSIRKPETRATLEEIANLFPPEEPTRVRLVNANKTTGTAGSQIDLAFEYEYPNNWLLAQVVLNLQGEEILVKTVHVAPLPDSVENTGRLSFAGKGPLYYLFFGLMIAIPLFIIYALVLCIRTPIPKRKWLWVFFVALGFGHVTLNWATGAITDGFVHVAIFGAGIQQMRPAGPLLISLSFPLGAIIFLNRRKQWL